MKKRLIRIGIGVVALGVVVLVASIFFLGSIVKKGVEVVGPRVTQVTVTLDGADVWLLPGHAHLRGLSVGNPSSYKAPIAIKVGDISVRLNTLSALSDKIIIDNITVKSPEITIEGGLRKNNLTQIEKNVNDYVGGDDTSSKTEAKPAASPPAAGKKLQINEIIITGAQVHMAGLFGTGANVTIPLPDIHLVNLGADEGGITAPEAAQKVLNALLASITTSATEAVGKLGKDVGLGKAGEKLKGLFGQ